jgi:hypothetical protein
MAPRRPSVTRINLHRRIICTQVPGEAAEGVVPAAGAEPEADGHEQAAHGGERPPAEAGLAARLRERLLPPADAERTRLSLSLIAPLPLPLLLHASPSLFSPFRCCACVHPSAASARTTLLQAGLATTDTSCESVVTSGHQNVAAAAPQAQPRDAGPAGYVRDPSPSLPASPCCFCLYFAMLLWLA